MKKWPDSINSTSKCVIIDVPKGYGLELGIFCRNLEEIKVMVAIREPLHLMTQQMYSLGDKKLEMAFLIQLLPYSMESLDRFQCI